MVIWEILTFAFLFQCLFFLIKSRYFLTGRFAMNIFNEVRALVKTEKSYTTKILQKLMVIERDKLYSKLKYPSLFQYIVRELGYSEAEATIRVHAVRLMLKSRRAEAKIVRGKLSLSNAAAANKALQNNSTDEKQVERVVENAEDCSVRGFKQFLDREFKRERKEVLVLEEYMLNRFDRLRKKYGDLSTLELIKIMLERELKDPNIDGAMLRVRPRKKNPRLAALFRWRLSGKFIRENVQIAESDTAWNTTTASSIPTGEIIARRIFKCSVAHAI